MGEIGERTASIGSEIDLESLASDPLTRGNEERQALFRKESKAVASLRFLVLGVLLFTGVLVALATFFFAKNHETDIFEAHFADRASTIFESFKTNVQLKLRALDSMSADISSQTRREGAEWPFVTVPDFEMKASKLRELTASNSIMLLPLVTNETRSDWEQYSDDHQDWLLQSQAYMAEIEGFALQLLTPMDHIKSNIFGVQQDDDESNPGPFLPLWQISPILATSSVYKLNMLDLKVFAAGFERVLTSAKAVIGEVADLTDPSEDDMVSLYLNRLFLQGKSNHQGGIYSGEPLNVMFYPILENFRPGSRVVAVLTAITYWHHFFADILPPNADGTICVLENTCGMKYTYRVDGPDSFFLGNGDLHDPKYDYLGQEQSLSDLLTSDDSDFSSTGPNDNNESCAYSLRVYPDGDMEDEYMSKQPAMYAVIVASVFAFASLAFITYNCMVERRQSLVLKQAIQSTAIVSSLFPEAVRDRLMETTTTEPPSPTGRERLIESSSPSDTSESSDTSRGFFKEPARLRLKNLLRDHSSRDVSVVDTKPIADLFPETTVMFADIAGFTAWSSQREPTQVFTLLQNVYQAFDKIARRRCVFKVETVGDSYVAVTGLPDPQEDHAVIMAGFAEECRVKMRHITRRLERTLGPETGDLSMRFGLHSGPVTAGVLRGEKSRFQLFGDTVNTAARMESTGQRGLIQVSEATALLLRAAGKEHWVKPREESVKAKGKGELNTFWLDAKDALSHRTSSSQESMTGDSATTLTASSMSSKSLPREKAQRGISKTHCSRMWGESQEVLESTPPTMLKRNTSGTTNRLIDWNVDVLIRLLKQVVAKRLSTDSAGDESSCVEYVVCSRDAVSNATVLDEVTEIITLPTFDEETAAGEQIDPESVELGDEVERQLRHYVTSIASMYRDNPFHNFEHACHVQMSMWKLLQRVVSPDEINYEGESSQIASEAHRYTYGITSDPLTQFAVVFCALIHDVDHTGVPNGQLIKEKAHVAVAYKNKSVAEQNSVDLAWDLLMDPSYKALRKCIYAKDTEFKRFRQLVVNTVLATDIFDKELSALRKSRWEKAFHEVSLEESAADAANRRATIVIEHLIQASDVSHTMQHWEVYRKWNERLFYEMYSAYKSGRTDSDPSPGWYKGELWFFDNYIIPLAKKLKNCGVFGVCSDECLNFALENRSMWEATGEQIVADMVACDYFSKYKQERIKQSQRRKNNLGLA